MLLTAANRKALPALNATEHVADPIAVVKFFDPCGRWTWYATEFDGVDEFFGLVNGRDQELGSFSLSELTAFKGPFGIGIERDRHFKPTPLSALQH